MFATKPLYSFNQLEKACIERRPSLQCKSPYVADAILSDSNSKTIIHTPALGCCGLSHNGSTVLISLLYDKNANENGRNKKKEKEMMLLLYPSVRSSRREGARIRKEEKETRLRISCRNKYCT